MTGVGKALAIASAVTAASVAIGNAAPAVSRERAAELLSLGRGQSSECDLNLTPVPAFGAPGGDIPHQSSPAWLPQPMGLVTPSWGASVPHRGGNRT